MSPFLYCSVVSRKLHLISLAVALFVMSSSSQLSLRRRVYYLCVVEALVFQGTGTPPEYQIIKTWSES